MTDEQAPTHNFNPKHRVVGAIILVSIAVLLLPLILSDRAVAPPPQPVAEAPTPDTRVVVTPITPVPLPSTPPADPVAGSSAPSTNPVLTPDPRQSHSDPILAVTPSKPVVSQGWIVQVGAFSDVDNASRLKEKLVRHGYAPGLDKIAVNRNQVVRVRVGPYGSEAEARTALGRIQQELGVKGVVRVYP